MKSPIRNFYEQFEATAARFPDRPAVEVQRRESVERFTYAELRSMAERVAAFLTSRGIGPGSLCAILADNAFGFGGVSKPFQG